MRHTHHVCVTVPLSRLLRVKQHARTSQAKSRTDRVLREALCYDQDLLARKQFRIVCPFVSGGVQVAPVCVAQPFA